MTAATPAAASAPEAARAGRRADGGGRRLGKYVANSSRADRRAERYRLRRVLWQVSTLPGQRRCGRVSRAGGGPVLRISESGGERVAGYAGLVSCGIMSCPVCSAKVGARRAEEIEHIVQRVHAEGGSAVLITLTARHRRHHDLGRLLDAVTYAWGRVTSGAEYRREVEQWGITGWVAVLEVTHSDAHSWHPHRHVLVLFDGPVSQEMAEELGRRWFDRWQRGLRRRGCVRAQEDPERHRRCSEKCTSDLEPIADRGGLDVRRVTGPGVLGQYLAKIQLEMASSATKSGRGGSRTPLQILADFADTGLADDWELWERYERAMRGRRTITWSQGVRERYGVRVVSDEEIIAEDMGGEDVIALPAETWREVRDRSEELLDVAERDGVVGATLWLIERGLEWHYVRPGPCPVY